MSKPNKKYYVSRAGRAPHFITMAPSAKACAWYMVNESSLTKDHPASWTYEVVKGAHRRSPGVNQWFLKVYNSKGIQQEAWTISTDDLYNLYS